MNRPVRALVILVCSGLLLSACKKKDDTAAAPADTGSAAAPADTGSAAAPTPAAASAAAPADTGATAPAATGSAAQPPPGPNAPPGAVVAPQRPIDDCCASLSGVAARARGRRKGDRSFRALEICPGIADLVRQGRATRAQALTQIRSALVGYDIPAACR
jgi:hypothetical protein